jgi:hypothetical protein
VAAAAMVGVVTWNTVALNGRVSRTERREHVFADAMNVATNPQSKTVQLVSHTTPIRPTPRFVAAYVPGEQQMSIFGSRIPEPASGRTYRLWLIRPGGASEFVGDFHPEDGIVVLTFAVDLAGYSGMLISEEETGTRQAHPSGVTRWASTL